MKQIIDMSIHFDENLIRWSVKFDKQFNTTSYQATTLHLPVHAATHIDAPLHFVADAVDVSKFPTEWMIQDAMIIDISYADINYPIKIEDLEQSFSGYVPRTIILKTNWYEKYWGTMQYWELSPYVTKDAAQWLADKPVDIIGYDFPQDFVIRNTLNETPDIEEFYVHNILTAKGIWQLEYLANLSQIKQDYFQIVICPLPLKGVEGSPLRVIGLV